MNHELTKEEKAAIASLKRLAKKWPKSLWLFSANGSLEVMLYPRDGSSEMNALGRRSPGVDRDYNVDTIYGIPNDGGDW